MLSQEEEIDLKMEINHIFDSGANEIRVLEMVKTFINRRVRLDRVGRIKTNDFRYIMSAINGVWGASPKVLQQKVLVQGEETWEDVETVIF